MAASTSRPFVGLLGWLLVCFVAGALGAAASVHAAEFYAQLVRPGWAPPAWLFGPAWTVLYLFMTVAAWLVWRRHGWREGRGALTLFLVQLAVNALWSWIFFAWHQGAWAVGEIVLLWVLIAATMVSFRRLSGLATLLLVPYLAWVTFAFALAFTCWRLNPDLL